MNQNGRPRPAPARPPRLLPAEFRHARAARDLFAEFLGREAYDEAFCQRLLDVAGPAGGATWEIRRLAVLMLEHQLLKLPPGRLAEFDRLLVRLSLKPAPGLRVPLADTVLREGYTTTDTRGFVRELRRRLARLDRVHAQIKGKRTTAEALRDFAEVSRRECKLTLARYLFTPDEVFAEILRRVRTTGAVADLDTDESPLVEAETARALAQLPDYEAAILRRLCDASLTYWVADQTSSEINSLVEYPLTTVVLVVKPPGSDVEFELKRAGRRGARTLGVVYARGGYTVPPSHRLDGGSMQWLLRYEAEAASRLAAIYRLAHREEPPVTRYISRSTVYAVPAGREEVQTLVYFTDPRAFGGGYQRMREALAESVEAFRTEGDGHLPALPGDLGLSAHFIGSVTPAQAVLSGTTSFRLDKLAAYLSDDGPRLYFEEGLRVTYTKHDARRFADALLEEVLGRFRPPAVAYRSQRQYLTAALAVPENRRAADRAYLSLVRQIAKCWGTLLAVRGWSRGESFVARNVGLKSFWAGGRWQVKVVFMDHDALTLASPHDKNFYAQGGVPSMNLDETYIWGESTPEQAAASEVGCLQRIYRVGARVEAAGRRAARAALREAYKQTQQEMLTNPALRRLFDKTFLRRLLDWDALVGGCLRANGHGLDPRWVKEAKRRMAAKGYRAGAFNAYLKTIERHRAFLEKYSFLFEGVGFGEKAARGANGAKAARGAD